MSSSSPPIYRVDDVWEMRCRFNHTGWFERYQASNIKYSINVTNPASGTNLPKGAKFTQNVSYFDDNGNQIAELHQYLKDKDNPFSLVGSGNPVRPDPVQLVIDGVMYRLPQNHEKNYFRGTEYLENGEEGRRFWLYRLYRFLRCRFFKY